METKQLWFVHLRRMTRNRKTRMVVGVDTLRNIGGAKVDLRKHG